MSTSVMSDRNRPPSSTVTITYDAVVENVLLNQDGRLLRNNVVVATLDVSGTTFRYTEPTPITPVAPATSVTLTYSARVIDIAGQLGPTTGASRVVTISPASIPLPNAAGNANTAAGNYVVSRANTIKKDTFSVRLDHQLNERLHAVAFARRALQQGFDFRTVAELHGRARGENQKLRSQVARDLSFVQQQQAFQFAHVLEALSGRQLA